jgi:hypothetical protein
MDGNRTRLNRIDNPVPYPEDYHGILNLLKMYCHVISTIHPIIQVRTGVGKSLGILVQRPLFFAEDSRLPLPYTELTFEESSQRDFLLLTL